MRPAVMRKKTICRRHRGFTYIECLVALLISAFVFLPLYTSFRGTIRTYRLFQDRRIAESRIESVGAILRNPAFYCGAGLPSSSSVYKKAFGSVAAAPFSWSGPISIDESDSGASDGCLHIAYAYPYPGGCLTADEYTVGKSSTSVTFKTAPDTSLFDLTVSTKATSVKNWVLFLNSYPRRAPMVITSASNKILKLKNYLYDEVTVRQMDKLMLFRALICWAEGGKLYTKDYRTTGNQPRVNGICDIRFEREDSLLTVYVIARGDDDKLAPGRIVNEDACRADLLEAWRGKSDYILYCEKFVWPLPNLGSS